MDSAVSQCCIPGSSLGCVVLKSTYRCYPPAVQCLQGCLFVVWVKPYVHWSSIVSVGEWITREVLEMKIGVIKWDGMLNCSVRVMGPHLLRINIFCLPNIRSHCIPSTEIWPAGKITLGTQCSLSEQVTDFYRIFFKQFKQVLLLSVVLLCWDACGGLVVRPSPIP